MKIKGYAQTSIGSREQNQDSFLMSEEQGLFAVADGVGGGYHGDVASKMATEGLLKYSAEKQLRTRVEKLQNDVLQEALNTIGEALMGTTLTVLQFQGSAINLAHVGDSRCYVYQEPLLKLITEDHELYDENIKGTVLASYLGLSPDVSPLRIQEETLLAAVGDRYLLCSDGLYRQIEENRIKEIIKENERDPQAIVDSLCNEATKAISSDNVTIVLVEITGDAKNG